MTDFLIKGQSLTVTRQGRQILDHVDLQIAQREFVTLVGPNGAGKTMLLKCLMGFYKPDLGMVSIAPDVKIGYMPQSISPDAVLPISVQRFLSLNLKVTQQDIDNVIAETGIDGLLDSQLHNLSGGERQKVLMARALINKPDILILDEPAQNLDVSGQLAFYKQLEHIYRTRELAILMVSHDLHLVMASTQKVVCLYQHVCCSGAPQTITQDPEFIAMFGDDMARMMAVYPHDHNHDHDHSHHDPEGAGL